MMGSRTSGGRRAAARRHLRRFAAGCCVLLAFAPGPLFPQSPPADPAPRPRRPEHVRDSKSSTPGARHPPPATERPVLRALRDELERTMRELSLPGFGKPYYAAYTTHDIEQVTAIAAFGSLISGTSHRIRLLRADVRVGDYELDNHNSQGDAFARGVFSPEYVPVDDDYDALRQEVWQLTDQAYKSAVDALEKKRAQRKNEAVEEDRPADFSREKPFRLTIDEMPAVPDQRRQEELARRVSAVFREFPAIEQDQVAVQSVARKRTFVSSEGSLTIEPSQWTHFRAVAIARAGDLPLRDFVSYTVRAANELPPEAQIVAEVRQMARSLTERARAPQLEQYSGPVLFEGRAAAQLLRAFLAENLGGTPAPRGKNPGGGRVRGESAWLKKIGRRVMPEGLAVEDAPGLAQFAGTPLLGFYRSDSEGVPAQRVSLIEDGKLERLLMSRTPNKKLHASNGHGRSGAIGRIRGRIGNLLLTARGGLAPDALRRRFLEEIEDADLDYGIVVRRLDEEDVTAIDRYAGRAAYSDGVTVQLPVPLEICKVTREGREEPLRGMVFEPAVLRSLKEIVAAGDVPYVYNFLDAEGAHPAGLESLGPMAIPTSIVTPALLFEEIELKKSEATNEKPPILPHPAFEKN